jgi:DNA-binding beta-propeller fold protein YncE
MANRSIIVIALVAALSPAAFAQTAADGGPYKVINSARVGGEGGFDYVFADSAGRRLYIPRSGSGARVTVFDLDTLKPAGEIPNCNARGAAVDPVSGHGFASSKPVVMWDTKTLAPIKTIPVDGNPDGILFDPFNQRVHVFSHRAPNDTVIDAKDGSVLGTIDLGGAPEQAVTDRAGHLYVDIEDKDTIAVVDAATMKCTGHYDLAGKGGGPAGLGFDVKNHILFASCREPQTMVILNSEDGKILTALPIGSGTDGAVFNPDTMEAFSSNRDGTLTVIKENSPTDFVIEQNVKTMPGAKTLTLDSKTQHILLIAAETAPPASQPAATQAQAQNAGGNRRGGRGQMVPGSFTILVVGK